MSKKVSLLAFVGVAALVAAAVAGFSSSARGAASGVTPLPSSSCGPVIYKGSGTPDYIIASDLPLQGAIRKQTVQISRAILWALAQKGYKAGSLKIGYQSCDDSTAQAGAWDSGKCATNGRLYASNRSVIGVVGTFNSGCAKIIVPILNRANPGPIPMVSPANTNVGLTKKWDPGEPQKYYPTGVRNYARVVATDDVQGPADAIYAKSVGIKKVYVLNDKQTYGFGVALTYKNAAKKIGLQVVGFKGWDAKQSSYEALANAIKQSGAQAVFLGGIACNNGAKLMQDIKATNPKIKLQMPDGFSDTERERRGRQRRIHQRRRLLAGPAERRRGDVRQELRQADRHHAEPVRRVRRAGDAADAAGRRHGQRGPCEDEQVALRRHGHERDPRQLHDQLGGRHQPRPDHGLQAGRKEPQAAEDDHARGEPHRVSGTETKRDAGGR